MFSFLIAVKAITDIWKNFPFAGLSFGELKTLNKVNAILILTNQNNSL